MLPNVPNFMGCLKSDDNWIPTYPALKYLKISFEIWYLRLCMESYWMDNLNMIRISWISQEPDRCPDRCLHLSVTGRPLEAYDPRLVRRHIFKSRCQSFGVSIEVLVNISISPFKDLYKSAHRAHCMYRVFIIWNWGFVVCSLCLSLSLTQVLCVFHFLCLFLSGWAGCDFCLASTLLSFTWYQSTRVRTSSAANKSFQHKPRPNTW